MKNGVPECVASDPHDTSLYDPDCWFEIILYFEKRFWEKKSPVLAKKNGLYATKNYSPGWKLKSRCSCLDFLDCIEYFISKKEGIRFTCLVFALFLEWNYFFSLFICRKTIRLWIFPTFTSNILWATLRAQRSSNIMNFRYFF